jgi:plasmid stability protein
MISLISAGRCSMAQLIVRNLEEEVVKALKMRAAQKGRSAEEEHREILRQALRPVPRQSLKDALSLMPDVGDDEDFERIRDLGRDVEL